MSGISFGKNISAILPTVIDINDISQFSQIQPQKQELSLADIFETAMTRFLANGTHPLDLYKPKRKYLLYFTVATATTALPIPFYPALTAQAGYDNTQFTTDKAYVAQVSEVYDLTADPTMLTNKYSAFNIGNKTVTLTGASDNTARNWVIACEGVPYQGLGSFLSANDSGNKDTRFRAVYAPSTAYATSDGYALTTQIWPHSPLIARLPLNNTGSGVSQDADVFAGASLKLNSNDRSGQGLVKALLGGIESGYITIPETTFTLGSNTAYRGIITNESLRATMMYIMGGAGIVFYAFLVKAEKINYNANHDVVLRNGELLLCIMTTNSTYTATNPTGYIRSSGNDGALDLFRIPERPILKGEVKVV